MNDVRGKYEPLTTPELLAAVPCSRHKLLEIRKAYGMVRPIKTVPPATMLWAPSMVETLRMILRIPTSGSGGWK